MTQVFEGVLLWFQTWLTEFMVGILTAVLGLTAVGCTISTKNRGDWQLTFGSQVGFSTQADSSNPASVSTDFPSLEEWFKAKAAGEIDGPPAPEPEPTPEPVTP